MELTSIAFMDVARMQSQSFGTSLGLQLKLTNPAMVSCSHRLASFAVGFVRAPCS